MAFAAYRALPSMLPYWYVKQYFGFFPV